MGVTATTGENTNGSLKDKTFCEVCCIETKIVLLYKHINSNQHKETEKYPIRNCMTYCEVCEKEIRKDERRDHIILVNRLEIKLKNLL